MNKAQSFGFDLLMIIICLVFFSELVYISFNSLPKDYFFERNIENHELLRASLMYNNSLAYFDCYQSFSSNNCLKSFNTSIKYALSSYLGGRDYLLSFCGIIYSSNSSAKCFSKAIPYYLNLSLPSGYCPVYFSIYDELEVSDCA